MQFFQKDDRQMAFNLIFKLLNFLNFQLSEIDILINVLNTTSLNLVI